MNGRTVAAKCAGRSRRAGVAAPLLLASAASTEPDHRPPGTLFLGVTPADWPEAVSAKDFLQVSALRTDHHLYAEYAQGEIGLCDLEVDPCPLGGLGHSASGA